MDPWVRSPIDAFVLRRLNAAGLEPAAPAERGQLLRRLYLDLTGCSADARINSIDFFPTGGREPMSGSLISCWRAPTTVSNGHARGSTQHVTRIATAIKRTNIGMSGPTGTGSSTR